MKHTYRLITLYAFVVMLVIIVPTQSLQAQWGIYSNPGSGLILPATNLNTGGIGSFTPTVQPKVLWHLYQTANRFQYPPILRLQAGGTFPTDPTATGESGIQFHRGPIDDVNEWRVASILPVSLNNASCSFRGGLSFTTNRSNTTGIPGVNGNCPTPAAETEMVRMTADGTGILQSNPLEALHIWKRLTFHVGSEADYIGYNIKSTVSNTLVRFDDSDPDRPNTPAMSLEFNRNGVMRLGNFGQGASSDDIRVHEDGGDFKGLVIGNTSGWSLGSGVADSPNSSLHHKDKTTVAIGMMWPEANSRLAIRSIGTTSATNALQIYNAISSPILTLNDNGSLGIRNSTPKGGLSLGDEFVFQDFPGASVIAHNAYYEYINPTSQVWKRVKATNRPARIMMNNDGINLEVAAGGPTPGTAIAEFAWSENGLYLAQATGGANVGIGMRQPSARLSVKATTNTSAASALNVNDVNNASLLTVRNDGKVGIGMGTGTFSSVAGSSTVYGTQNTKLQILGDVQIGSSWNSTIIASMNNRLSVDGAICAKEVRVTASQWADFVFKKSYSLPTLESVEQFISDNGHLPGIPSEQEVKENGVSLNEMQVKLLQKVEELTLYVIELKKQNERLEKQLQSTTNQK